jgi:triacylglycerol lipase
MLAGLSPARRRVVLILAAVVLVAAGALAVVLVPRPAVTDRAPVDQDRLGPVLLVPGYGGATGSLESLAGRLTAAGRDATVVPLPGNGTGDLRDATDALDRAATAALDRTGEDSVDVIGYSAGGIIARLWVADGDAGVVRRVLTLGSPHHGTSLAEIAGHLAPSQCPVGCQQLSAASDLLRELNAGDETPAGPTWVSIWTTQDTTVTPPDSAQLEGAVNLTVQSVCPDAQVGHDDLPSSPLVQRMVLAQLAPGRPAQLGTADCAQLSW